MNSEPVDKQIKKDIVELAEGHANFGCLVYSPDRLIKYVQSLIAKAQTEARIDELANLLYKFRSMKPDAVEMLIATQTNLEELNKGVDK